MWLTLANDQIQYLYPVDHWGLGLFQAYLNQKLSGNFLHVRNEVLVPAASLPTYMPWTNVIGMEKMSSL